MRRIINFALVTLTSFHTTGLTAATLELARDQRVALIIPNEVSVAERLAIEDLASFLQRSIKAVVRRQLSTVPLSSLDEPAALIFGTAENNAALGKLLQQGKVKAGRDLGPEGSLVQSLEADGKTVVVLMGQTGRGASYAAYSFLENELGIGFFIDGNRVPDNPSVSLAGLHRAEVPAASTRGLFHHHTWKHPHANCWRLWSADRWKESIDWMRRKRFNTLPMMHDAGGYMWGDVIFREFPEIKKNDETLALFAVDPSWRTKLNKEIFQYARESGISIAYNLFYTQVPEFFPKFFPDLEYLPLNMRNVGIEFSQPECRQIMKRYWKAILDTFGIDDSHTYYVCSYQHERHLPDNLKNRNPTTIEAWEVLKEIDPDAQMYVETWCWKYRHECPDPYVRCPARTPRTITENPGKEWLVFNQEVPREIGVVEWDLFRNSGDRLPRDGFDGRPYIQLTHSNFEGWWPPNGTRNHPRYLIDFFADALDRGAHGVVFFHIQASINEMIADLAAQIGWTKRVDLTAFYRDWARRRFGPTGSEPLAESLRAFYDAIDFGATLQYRDQFLSLVSPGYNDSAEDVLSKLELQGEARLTWLRERLAVFEDRAAQMHDALLPARALASLLEGNEFFDDYMWQLDYVSMRLEGIQSLYRAHLVADSQPEAAQRYFNRALGAFQSFRELFRVRPRHSMSRLREIEPEVPYTKAFVDDWETRGHWEHRGIKSGHVIIERFDLFEDKIRALKP